MNCFIFYKINSYFILIDNSINVQKNVSGTQLFSEKIFVDLVNGQIVHKNKLIQIFKERLHFKSVYYLIRKNDNELKYLVFIPYKTTTRYFHLFIKQNFKHVDSYAIEKIMRFNLAQRNQLLQSLFGNKTVLKDCLKAFANYFFFDRFVFWVYNPFTKYFCSMASSHSLKKEFIEESDKSSLHNFLNSSASFETRPPNRDCINANFAQGMQSLCRLRLDLSKDGEVGVLDFLSVNHDFMLGEEVRMWIANVVETKYLEFRQKSQAVLLKVEQYFATYRPKHFEEFLYGLTEKISKDLCFQSCSIWQEIPNEHKLKLIAITDKRQQGKPQREITYNLKEKSFTASVYLKGEFNFSYDLANDPKNTHTYDETTHAKGKTWIAIPLKVGDIKWGLLRVKNKHLIEDRSQLANLLPYDFMALNIVCTNLSNIYDLNTKYINYINQLEDVEQRRKKLEKDYVDLRNFYRVFLHEVRTPISTFGPSTEIIKDLLSGDTTEEIKKSIKNKVDDIRVMGERLSFIATKYYFREIVKSSYPEELSVLADIILPVLNISKTYIKKQFDVDIILHSDQFEGLSVYGDKILLNIVFNTLISNAGKYSPRSKNPIEISCEVDSRYLYIVVSNYGFPIYKEEAKKIFENGYRGKAAKDQILGGTGIGLYLAKEIMINQKGDIILSSLNNPVVFKIQIPLILI